jgi:hypothetical protein
MDDKLNFDGFDIDSFDFSSSVRFNFDTVVYSCVLSLNRVFDGGVSSEDGFTKYLHLVEHMAVVAGAAGMLPSDYDSQVVSIISSVPSGMSGLERSMWIARKKLEVVVRSIQKRTPRKEPLKVV